MVRDVTVRPATPDDLPDVLGVLNAGALETDADRVRASIDRGETFVAVRNGPGDGPDSDTAEGTVLGALVLVDPDGGGDPDRKADPDEEAEIDAIAVRRRQRGQGIGRTLVAAAADRYDRLTAEFDGSVRPFYESLGFRIQPIETSGRERYRGRLDGDREGE